MKVKLRSFFEFGPTEGGEAPSRMHIILKDTSSDRYVSQAGWTSLLKDALDFVTSSKAITYCTGRNLPDMECLYTFPDPKHNFTVPISAMH